MEEKIVEGKFKKSVIPLITCALAVLFIIICAANQAQEMTDYIWYYGDANIIDGLISLVCFESYLYEINPIMFYVWVLVFLISLLMFFMTKGCAITISTTRVVGKASFGKRVDLPLSQISAIGLGIFNSISVSTSSGRVSFWLLSNRKDVHEALSDQIAKFQNTQNTSPVSTVSTDSSADELKKYKDLLDAGIITQEEFDAKKKQLLGL